MVSRLDVAVLIAMLCAGAVLAVPRHAQISTELRLSQVNALARGANTAAQLAHSRWLAAGQPATIEGARGIVAMTNGYPSAATLPLMLAEAEMLNFRYGGGVWQPAGVSADQRCGVAYQPPAAPGKDPDIIALTSDC